MIGYRREAGFLGHLQATIVNEQPAHLIIGNNVLAHVPDINDFQKASSVSFGRGVSPSSHVETHQGTQFDTVTMNIFLTYAWTVINILQVAELCVAIEEGAYAW